MPRTYPQEHRAYIFRWYGKKPVVEIARELGRTPQQIMDRASDWGLGSDLRFNDDKAKPQWFYDEVLAKFGGATTRELAVEYDVPITTMEKWLERAKYGKRRHPKKAAKKEEATQHSQKVVGSQV